ncbi:type II and III secretion system protein family protein [Persicimonas caeni]|nr:pilus assembly protein N-terminal domain-containing protein [Persicimonas caeni]
MKLYKRLGVLFLLMLASTAVTVSISPTPVHAQAPDKEFTISVGETLTFSGRGVRSVSIGLPQIADAQVADNRQLIVTGKQPGTTTINIYGSSGQKTLLIRVVGTNPQSLAEEVREVLGPGSGVDVRVVKGRVLLEGEVAGEKFKRKIEALTTLYPNQVLNFTTYREAFVEGARMVAVDIYFVQLATTNRDQLGVKWGQFIGANYTFGSGDVPLYYGNELDDGVTPGNTGTLLSNPAALTGGDGMTSYWSLVGQVNVALDFLVENGLIKTISHGTIVTEAGKTASYHNGGTLLIRIAGLSATALREVPYGLKVEIKPVIDANDNVKLEVVLDYSELDYANAVNEVPALRNNAVESVVNTMAGQSVLVSTQENLNNTSNSTGWYMLSRIPILGWLFKSRNYVATTLDNALFITPRVYEPGEKTHDEYIDGVFKQLIESGAEPEDLPDLDDVDSGGGSAPANNATGNSQSGGGANAQPSLLE